MRIARRLAPSAMGGIAALLVACSAQPHRGSWSLTFASPDMANRAASLEARIIEGGCSGGALVYSFEVGGPNGAGVPPILTSAKYGFAARAKDKSCRWFAEGCVERTLPLDGESMVDVVLEPITEHPACDPSYCVAGRCGTAPCVASPEACNDLDDDCDGNVDEDFDLANDVTHCGGCATSCSLAGATEACAASTCTVSQCESGHANCDGNDANGCETDLMTTSNCGGCGIVCTGTALCAVEAGGAARCVTSCPSASPTLCGMTCVNTTSNPSHCNGCNTSCGSPAHAQSTCVSSACSMTCDAGYGDCNANRSDGCETALATSVSNCGRCGTVCSRPHAVPRCSAQQCSIGTCDAGWDSCDGNDANGCETQLASSNAHCGRCNNPCANGGMCVGGVCQSSVVVDAKSEHACAIRATGAVACWGQNEYGQLGDGTTTVRSSFITVPSVVAQDICVGWYHSCALLTNGTVKCWGRNSNGQLGDGTKNDSPSPVAVSGLTGVTKIGCNDEGTCAIVSGRIKCWGQNNYGQLGDGTTSTRSSAVDVQGITSAVQVTGGNNFNCARLTDGTLRCWGANGNGQLGDGTINDSLAPVQVKDTTGTGALAGVTTISSSDIHVCALKNDGSALCWGRNGYGRLGDGTSTDRSRPVVVLNLVNVVDIHANIDNTCAVVASGKVYCWGRGTSGANGNGSTSDSSSPVQVSGVSGASKATGGDLWACSSLADGRVFCWGANDVGQLGDGSTSTRSTAAAVSGLP